MRVYLLLLVVVAGVACGKSDRLKWNEHKLTKIEIGGFKFEIPKGWRDLSESAIPALARATRQLGPDTDAHIIVRETDSNTDTNISFMLAELTGEPTCEQWVAAMEMQGGPKIDHATVLPQQYGADKGCSFSMSDGDSQGKMHLRFRGPKFLTIQCLRPAKGDASGDATCDTVVAALRAQP